MNEADKARLERETSEMEDRILKLVQSKFPIKYQNGTLNVTDLRLERPAGLFSLSEQHRIKMMDGSLLGKLRGRFVYTDAAGKETRTAQWIILDGVPYKTIRNSYIVDGNEKTISSQFKPASGVYTGRDKDTVVSTVRFNNAGGVWTNPVEIRYEPFSSKFNFVFKDQRRKEISVPGLSFLQNVVGAGQEEIRRAVGSDEVLNLLVQNSKGQQGLAPLYAVFFPREMFHGTPEEIIKLRDRILEQATFGPGGERRVQSTIGVSSNKFDKNVILATISKLFRVAANQEDEDEEDDLRYKVITGPDDIILEKLESSIQEFQKELSRRPLAGGTLRYALATPTTHLRKSMEPFIRGDVRAAKTAKGVVESPEMTNPLEMISATNKVKSNLSRDQERNADSIRNLPSTGISRIDPVESPESGKIGLVRHLTSSARVANGTIYSKYYKVVRGSAKMDSSNIVELDPSDEYDSYCAFYDPAVVIKTGSTLSFKNPTVEGRYHGKVVEIPREQIEYVDTSPYDLFASAANLIPFGDHNDGNRMLMGTNMQKQALLLTPESREAPLVQVAMDDSRNRTFEDEVGEKANAVHSEVSGRVESVGDSKIVVVDKKGAKHVYEVYQNFPGNQDHFVHNEIRVKPGDSVEAGQLLADGWQTKDGKLALGLNARVGYLPYKGWNYEDGVVISQGFAERVRTDEMETRIIEIPKDFIGGPGSNAKSEYPAYTGKTAGLDKLDKDGIIKPGETVGPGDILVAMLAPKRPDMDDLRRLASALLAGGEKDYVDKSAKIGAAEYLNGTVLDVTVLPGTSGRNSQTKNVIKVRIKTSKALKLGDKISGRHGNKGTITKILSDKEMPRTEDGRPIDLLFSPLVVPSRKNVGQLLEVNAGLVAEKTGQPFKVYNFDPTEVDRVQQGLDQIGVPDGKMKVIDPLTGKALENPVTVGNMYVLKLKHKADEKIQARAFDGALNQKYLVPQKRIGEAAGEKANPQSLGEMEMRALQAHGAAANILESTTLKGDGAGFKRDRMDIYRYLATGDQSNLNKLVGKSSVPESMRILKDKMFTMGMNVTPMVNGKRSQTLDDAFSELLVTPTKDDDVLRIIGKANKVTSPGTYRSVDLRTGKKDEPVEGGLYDRAIFGDDGAQSDTILDRSARSKWGYVELNAPMPNPILFDQASYNPYKILTGLSKKDLELLMSKDHVMVTNPGNSGLRPNSIILAKAATDLLVEGKNFEYKVGGDALSYLLSKVNVDKELADAEQKLRGGQLKGDKRDNLYRKWRVLKGMKDNNLNPQDFMTRIVPVTPRYLRPWLSQGETVTQNGVTKIYSNLINVNEKSRAALGFGTPENQAEQSEGLYRSMSYLYGLGEKKAYKDPIRNQTYEGISDLLGGKEGLVRDRMLGKKEDYSGRSVIGVDPTLKLNQVGIPADMARTVYRPFIVRKLIEKGCVPSGPDGEALAHEKIARLDDDVRVALNEVVKERPVLINRAPTLHKHSIQAFEPVIKSTQDGRPVKSIQLNPLVVTGFGADFDGDQMGIHVPLTDAAVEEAKNLMMPSSNLISPTTGNMIIEIRHEMLLGVYYLTMNADQPTGTNVTFNAYSQLRKDYESGKITSRQKVTLHGVTTTAGQWLFFDLIPKSYRDKYFGQTMAKKQVSELLRSMYDDIVVNKTSKMSLTQLSDIIDDIKDLGFIASTRSGLSIGVNDLKVPDEFKNSIAEKAKAIDEELKGNDSALVGKYIELEKAIEDDLRDGKVLDKENPVSIMMQSRARGDAGQIRRMGVMVGVGRDINDKLMAPIAPSHLQGLTPGQYWTHSYDALKGISDRSLSTAKPGALTREIWAATQDKVISEEDCHTVRGIPLNINGKIVGRYAAKDITGANGRVFARAGEPITLKIRGDLLRAAEKDKSLVHIEVRSPATCASTSGICRKCYGWETGRSDPPRLGTAVGVIASQAIGEPLAQSTMKTFHSGGTSSNVTLGLPRVDEIFGMSQNPINKAVVSQYSGTVTSIVDQPNLTAQIHIGNKMQRIPLDEYGNKKPLKVKIGDVVMPGDFLTVGDVDDLETAMSTKSQGSITSASPSDLMKFTSNPEDALRRTQNYLINSTQFAIDSALGENNAIDRRHIELTVGKLTENVVITDAGDSPFMVGQELRRNEVERWNAENTGPYSLVTRATSNAERVVGRKAGDTYMDRWRRNVVISKGEVVTQEKLGQLMMYHREIRVVPLPAKFENVLHGKKTAPDSGHDNWLSNLGTENVREQLARGTVFGQKDKLEDPRARQMAGKLVNVGPIGFSNWQRFKSGVSNFANKVGGSILDMFSLGR